ncbi:hypothetical protein BC940DRAFT_294367, partial [Gongronella butleri]
MELEYVKERCQTISNQPTEIKRFKAKLMDVAYLYDRFKNDSDGQLRRNLQQLDHDLEVYRKQEETIKPLPLAGKIVVAGLIIVSCILLHKLYQSNAILFFLVVFWILAIALIPILSNGPCNSDIQGLRDICSAFIYAIEHEVDIKHNT